MKLFCKELKGSEISLEVASDETTIGDVKKLIEGQINIPVSQQKLLYLGKILHDSSQIKDYRIKDNAKLMLTRMAKPDLKKLIQMHLSKFYDSEMSAALAELFFEQMKAKLNEYSLDDLDKLCETLSCEPENV